MKRRMGDCRGLGDGGTWRWEDLEMGRLGDGETWRLGDGETWRLGDGVIFCFLFLFKLFVKDLC